MGEVVTLPVRVRLESASLVQVFDEFREFLAGGVHVSRECRSELGHELLRLVNDGLAMRFEIVPASGAVIGRVVVKPSERLLGFMTAVRALQ